MIVVIAFARQLAVFQDIYSVALTDERVVSLREFIDHKLMLVGDAGCLLYGIRRPGSR